MSTNFRERVYTLIGKGMCQEDAEAIAQDEWEDARRMEWEDDLISETWVEKGEKDAEAAIFLLWDIIADGLEQKDMSEIAFLTKRIERAQK